MIIRKINFYLGIFLFLTNINFAFSINIKTLVLIDNKIITSEDLKKEKTIFRYLFNNNIDEKNLDKIALENLIDISLKNIEVKKNNIQISDLESAKYLEIILKNYNKSLKDFREKINDKVYEDYFKNRIKTEISWNKLILVKYSNLININIDEVIAKTAIDKNNTNELDKMILIEKNKKLQSLSETYFKEIKNKTLIKYQ